MLGGKQTLAFVTSCRKSFHLNRPHSGDAHDSSENSARQKFTNWFVWERKVSSNEMTLPLPSGCAVQHQSKCVFCYSIVQQKLCIIFFDQLCDTYSEFPVQIARVIVLFIYHHIYNIRCTKSHNSNVSCLVLQLSLSNPLKQGVKSRMKM